MLRQAQHDIAEEIKRQGVTPICQQTRPKTCNIGVTTDKVMLAGKRCNRLTINKERYLVRYLKVGNKTCNTVTYVTGNTRPSADGS